MSYSDVLVTKVVTKWGPWESHGLWFLYPCPES